MESKILYIKKSKICKISIMTYAETENLKDKKTENVIEAKRTYLKIRIFLYAILILNLIEYAILEIPKSRDTNRFSNIQKKIFY